MVVVFGLLNAIGVEVFGKVEVFLTFGMWTTLTIFGLCGILLSPVTHHSGGLAHRLMSVIFLVCLVILAWRCLCSSVVNWSRQWRRKLKSASYDSQSDGAWPLAVAGCMFLYGAAINRQVNNVVVDAANHIFYWIRRWLFPPLPIVSWDMSGNTGWAWGCC